MLEADVKQQARDRRSGVMFGSKVTILTLHIPDSLANVKTSLRCIADSNHLPQESQRFCQDPLLIPLCTTAIIHGNMPVCEESQVQDGPWSNMCQLTHHCKHDKSRKGHEGWQGTIKLHDDMLGNK